MMKRLFLLLSSMSLLVGNACVGVEKSSNPLSPNIAGPIAGVIITAPTPVAPQQGSKLAVSQQPITLVVSNATTSGVRPLNYVFEVAADVDFTNRILVREGVEPGANGQTTLRLGDQLSPERSYYWRSKAQDGANTGGYSYPVVFTIFTPIVIGRPQPLSPSGSTSSAQPRFVIGNASRSGPVGRITYFIEVSDNEAFAGKLGEWAVQEQSGQTSFDSPIQLPRGKPLYWRAQAADPSASGAWSDARSFTIATVPSPGAACGTTLPTTPLGIVECRRSKFGSSMSDGEIVALLKGVASDLNKANIAGGPFGILEKGSGANCNGYSCDIICSGQNNSQKQWDVLGDAEGAAYPTWSGPHTVPNIRVDTCEIQ
jgi:hypothetical protein